MLTTGRDHSTMEGNERSAKTLPGNPVCEPGAVLVGKVVLTVRAYSGKGALRGSNLPGEETRKRFSGTAPRNLEPSGAPFGRPIQSCKEGSNEQLKVGETQAQFEGAISYPTAGPTRIAVSARTDEESEAAWFGDGSETFVEVFFTPVAGVNWEITGGVLTGSDHAVPFEIPFLVIFLPSSISNKDAKRASH